MIAVKKQDRYFTPEEYFAWEEQQLEKHELIDGLVYAMSGGTKNHSAIKLNIAVLLKDHLRGSKCRVFNSDLKSINLSLPIKQFYEEVVFESSTTEDENGSEKITL